MYNLYDSVSEYLAINDCITDLIAKIKTCNQFKQMIAINLKID